MISSVRAEECDYARRDAKHGWHQRTTIASRELARNDHHLRIHKLYIDIAYLFLKNYLTGITPLTRVQVC